MIKRRGSWVSFLTVPHSSTIWENIGCLEGQRWINTGHILEDFGHAKRAAAQKSNIHLKYVRWLSQGDAYLAWHYIDLSAIYILPILILSGCVISTSVFEVLERLFVIFILQCNCQQYQHDLKFIQSVGNMLNILQGAFDWWWNGLSLKVMPVHKYTRRSATRSAISVNYYRYS